MPPLTTDQAQYDLLPRDQRSHVYKFGKGFRVNLHRKVPNWLYLAIKGIAWSSDPEHQGEAGYITIYLNNVRTGTTTFDLNGALQARTLLLDVLEGLGNYKDLAMQLIWILTHLDLQQPRQGSGEAIFWHIHQASLTAHASPKYNMITWAQSYHNHQMAHPAQQLPVVVHLSSQILEWARRPPEHLQSQAVQPAQPPNQVATAGFANVDATEGAENDVPHNAAWDAADDAAHHAAWDAGLHTADGAARDAADDTVDMSFLMDLDSPRLRDVGDFETAHLSDSMAAFFDHGMVGQQLPVEDFHYQYGSLDGSPGVSPNDQEAFDVQHGEPVVEQSVPSVMLEDLEDEAMQIGSQASSHFPVISGPTQAAASSQHGMLDIWHTAPAAGFAATSTESNVASSTEESVTPFPGELAQVDLINQSLDAGSTIDDTAHHNSELDITRARLRLALAAVRTTVDNDSSVSPEHAQRLQELLNAFLAENQGDEGDQAYFRLRALTTIPMRTGDVALIRGGRLHRIGADASYQFSEGDQFGIVSDTYVKWRGGKIPTREEESQGHWIAAIGQLPVMVTGAVECNQFIVASMTDPPMGQPLSAVNDPSAHHRVVALTLEAKETEAPGLVMAFAMFGLPAIAGMLKTEVGLLWTKVDSIAEDMEKLKLSVPQQASSHVMQLLTHRISVLEAAQAGVKQHNEVFSMMEGMAGMNLGAVESSAAELALAPWKRENKLPPLDRHVLVGQQAQLTRLQELMQADGYTVLTLWGAAGMGKTTLAIAFAHQLWDREQVGCVCYADLRGHSSIETAVEKVLWAFQQLNSNKPLCMPQMGCHVGANGLITEQICELLQQCGGLHTVCLVIDNADDLVHSIGQADEFESAIAQLLIALPSMVIIVSSQDRMSFSSPHITSKTLELQPLATEDAERMIRQQVAKQTPQAVVTELAALCGNIPIVLSVVSRSIPDTEPSAAQNMVEVLRSQGIAKGVASINKNAWERLQLGISSSLQRLAPDDRLFLAILTMFPNTFSATAAAAILSTSWSDTIACLIRLRLKSWITTTNEAVDSAEAQYQLHLLVKRMAASAYQADSKYLKASQAFIHHFLDMLPATVSEYSVEGIQAMQQLRLQRLNLKEAFSKLASQEAPVSLVDLNKYCHLGLFALRALDRLRVGAKQVAEAMEKLVRWADSSATAEDIAGARAQLGYVLSLMPQHWERAEHELKTALSAQRDLYGADHSRSVVALAGLAALKSAQARAGTCADDLEQQAAYYTQQLYSVMCTSKGEADPDTVICALEVAKRLPNTVHKLRWLEQATTAAQQELGCQDPVVLLLKYEQLKLRADSDFATVKDSIPDLQQSLEVCIEQRGSQDSLTINAKMCLGEALVHSQQAAEQQQGLELLHEAIAAMTATYSREDVDVLGAQLDHLVPSLIWAQQADSATELLSRLQPAFVQAFGENSLMVVGLLRQHAAACYAKDEYKTGEAFLRTAIVRAKAMKQGASGIHQTTFVAEQGLFLELASNLEEQGRYDQAQIVHENAVEVLRSSQSRASLDHLRADHLISLAALQRRQCNYDTAAALLQQARKDCEGHEEQTCRAMLQQSKVANDRGDKEAALQLMLTTQSMFHKCNPNSKYRAFFLCEDLGWVYFHREEWSNAVHWLDKAVAIVGRLAAGSCQVNFQSALCYAGSAAVRLQLSMSVKDAELKSTLVQAATDFQLIAERCINLYGCKGTNGMQRALFYLGMCLKLQGRNDEALTRFEEALHAQLIVYNVAHPSSAVFEAAVRSVAVNSIE